MLCSCLDVIGDTELAIQSYLKQENPKDDGAKYLIVYGILQTLFLQQDAIKNLSEALNLEFKPDPTLTLVRNLRNDSVGHPTRRGFGNNLSFNFINRSSLVISGFELITFYPNENRPKFTYINIIELISKQSAILENVLNNVIDSLEKEEMAYKSEHKDEKLSDIFPPTLPYHFEKINEAIYRAEMFELGKVNIHYISDLINKFIELLKKREIFGVYDSIDYCLDNIAYPLQELTKYFDSDPDNSLNDKSALIFAFYLYEQMKELLEISRELDEEIED